MNGNYKKNVMIVLLAVVMAFVTCGCGFFNDSKEGEDKITPAVYITQTEITLAEGDTVQMSAVSNDDAEITWVSLAPETATVNETGLLTGVKVGETMIIAMSSTEATAFCTIKVTKPQPGITEPPQTETPDPEVLVLAMSSIGLTVGSNVTLTATSSIGAEITWSSSDPTVATVSSSGRVVGLAVGTAVISVTTGTATAKCNVTVTAAIPEGAEKPGYSLVWNDEFDGNTLDRTKWNFQTGTYDVYHDFHNAGVNFWGNDEAQYYTQDAVSVADGSLVITATKQDMPEGRTYKSGRILTRDLASWTYGFFEAKIKTPTGSGMWPAFWMLPQPSSYANVNNKYGGWPYNGEIDIMEAKGRLFNKVDTTLHYGPIEAGGWTSKYNTSEYTMSTNTDQWHTYGVEWTSQYIKWFVDGTAVMTIGCDTWYTLSSASAGAASPFDQPFYILLNLAVGGRYDNYNMPAENFISASMYVDYVRVYKKN